MSTRTNKGTIVSLPQRRRKPNRLPPFQGPNLPPNWRQYGPKRKPTGWTDPLPRTDLDSRNFISNQPQLSRTVTSLSNGAIPRGAYFGLRSADASKNYNSLDLSSKRYINAVVNPFGTDAYGIDHIDRNSGIRVPTLSQVPTFTMTFYRKGVFVTDGSVSTHVVFCPTRPTTDVGVCVDAMYCTGGGASPTAYTRVINGTSDAVWFASTLAKYYRIVACGIKANPITPLDETRGHFCGSPGDDTAAASTVVATVPATWPTWATISDSNQPQSFSASQGCTARYDPTTPASGASTSTSREDFAAPTVITNNSYLGLPHVELDGSYGSSFLIELVMYLEILPTDRSNCPLTMGYSPSSNDWQAVGRIISDKEMNPVVSHGHSFKDFMANLWGGIKKFGKGVYDFVSDPNKMGQVTNFAKGIGQMGSMILPLL